MPPDSTQNLNARLSTRRRSERSQGELGNRREARATRSAAPPVRIAGAGSSYRGGYRVDN